MEFIYLTTYLNDSFKSLFSVSLHLCVRAGMTMVDLVAASELRETAILHIGRIVSATPIRGSESRDCYSVSAAESSSSITSAATPSAASRICHTSDMKRWSMVRIWDARNGSVVMLSRMSQ